ncbi:amino acid permease [Rhodomicrobium udaipurense JA643]|uniref:Amino acid permease n=1 Tax=Rhodomicrobium udaipurense TaxID=1202716 RepID=A0A8I1GIF6_9HYPH|nr:amino acid permease [Rhodomicrobium udaipurense]KAI94563.1 amino acid permease [Rhodomicrobium udaipurense JA643]MBJ7545076.1 amino acid permease [Rhodomicrobium udaipurense]
MSDASVCAQEPAASSSGGKFGSVDLPKISVVTATALAVADMIGTGVFTSLGFQVRDIPSAFSLLMLWVVGGLVALCGALSYAELAAAFPRSGGEYNFLSRAFRPAIGFMAGWISATVGFAAPVALAAMAFGQYFAGVVPGAPVLLLGIAVVWLVSLVHLMGVKTGSKLQNVSTFVKFGLIVVFIAAGFIWGEPQPISFAPSAADLGYMASAPFALSLVFVLYSYSGWNAATYIASEIKEPEKTLPRALLFGVLIVTVLYVALNAAFLYTTPVAELAGQIDVGLIAGRHIFGETGGQIVAALICLGLVSAVSAMMWIGPRVAQVMGEDNPMLSFFAKTSNKGVPVNALVFQLVVVTALLFTQGFETVLEFIQFALTLCSFLTVLGVIVLRIRRPDLPRPYMAWAYPLTPVLFLAVTGSVLVHLLIERPGQSLASLGLMIAGLFIYAISAKFSAAPSKGIA